jgi:RES domain-containing protein
LPDNWRTLDARDALQSIGLAWLQSAQSAVLNVPSAVVPAERNYLLNPLHPHFSRIRFGQPQSLLTDTRLLRNLNHQ